MNKTTVNDAVVVQVFKTGEKKAGLWSRRGRKPQGYNVYIGGALVIYIPYESRILKNKIKGQYFYSLEENYSKWLVK